MSVKERLSASVDAELIEAAESAVAKGRSESVSAWVNDALRLKLAQERRLEALSAFIEDYEAEHGQITPEEMRLAVRGAQASALTVRGSRTVRTSVKRRPRSARNSR